MGGFSPAPRAAPVLLAVLVVLLTGCGSGGGSKPSNDARAPPPPAASQTQPQEERRPIPKPRRNPFKQPHGPGAHPGARVHRVIVHDVVKGTGTTVHEGDSVYLDYIEANYTSGEVFFAAWGPRRTETTMIRRDIFMQGLIRGIDGMRVGGRRTIIVPARLSDVNDSDRAGHSYKQIVYYDLVLLGVIHPER